MKRVCTLRKVLFSVSKVLLEKLFFIVLKHRGFYHHSVLIVLWNISCREIFYVANISIFFETCKFLSIFFSKKANFLMFFIKQPPYWASNPSIFPFFLHFAHIKPTPYHIQGRLAVLHLIIYRSFIQFGGWVLKNRKEIKNKAIFLETFLH